MRSSPAKDVRPGQRPQGGRSGNLIKQSGRHGTVDDLLLAFENQPPTIVQVGGENDDEQLLDAELEAVGSPGDEDRVGEIDAGR